MEKMGRKNLNALGFAVYFDEFDRYFKSSSDLKTDILILYNENTDTELLWSRVNALSGKYRISVSETIPGNQCYSTMEDLRK